VKVGDDKPSAISIVNTATVGEFFIALTTSTSFKKLSDCDPGELVVRAPKESLPADTDRKSVDPTKFGQELTNPKATLADVLKPTIEGANGEYDVFVELPAKPEEKTFTADGIPSLGTLRDGSRCSIPSESLRHEAVVAEQAKFAVCEDLKLISKGNVVWQPQFLQKVRTYTTENDIRNLVIDVLLEAIVAAGLSGKVNCLSELSVFDLRADIWLVMSHDRPVGVVEVKLPGEKIMRSPNVYGQIFDDMMSLRSFHGLKHVFGIVTTYEEWQIFWLPETMTAAASTVAPPLELRLAPPEMKNEEVECCVQKEDEEGAEALSSAMPQKCYRGGVFKSNAADLPLTLCSLFRKMNASPSGHVKLLDDSRPYVVMTPPSFNTRTWRI